MSNASRRDGGKLASLPFGPSASMAMRSEVGFGAAVWALLGGVRVCGLRRCCRACSLRPGNLRRAPQRPRRVGTEANSNGGRLRVSDLPWLLMLLRRLSGPFLRPSRPTACAGAAADRRGLRRLSVLQPRRSAWTWPRPAFPAGVEGLALRSPAIADKSLLRGGGSETPSPDPGGGIKLSTARAGGLAIIGRRARAAEGEIKN